MIVPRSAARAAAIGLVFLAALSSTAFAPAPNRAPEAFRSSAGAAARLQERPESRVEVRVQTGEDGAPATGRRVALEIQAPGQPVDRRAGTTGDDGIAVFESVPAGPGASARAAVERGETAFTSAPTPLRAGETVDIPVTVWDTTSQGQPLHVDRLHLILRVEAPALSRVAQVLVVRNVADTAYLSDVTGPDGRRAGLVIPVPSTAVRVQAIPPPNSDLDPEAVAVDGNRLLDLRPVPPGVRNVAVSYEVQGDEDGQRLEITLPYPTQTVDLLVHGAERAGLDLEAPGFTEQQPRALGQQGTFANWTSGVVDAGGTVTIRLTTSGLGLEPGSWALLALSAALLLAAAGSFLAGRFGIERTADRDEILERIARLDRAHEAGDLTESDYYARRSAALEELLALDRAGGRRGEGPSPP